MGIANVNGQVMALAARAVLLLTLSLGGSAVGFAVTLIQGGAGLSGHETIKEEHQANLRCNPRRHGPTHDDAIGRSPAPNQIYISAHSSVWDARCRPTDRTRATQALPVTHQVKRQAQTQSAATDTFGMPTVTAAASLSGGIFVPHDVRCRGSRWGSRERMYAAARDSVHRADREPATNGDQVGRSTRVS